MRGFKGFLLLVVLFSYLNAGGFALSGVGTRELSIGGAARTSATGFYALFWNPALLDSSYHNNIQISTAEVIPLITFTPNTGLLSFDGPYSKREKVYNKTEIFTIPNVGYTFYFKGIAFGAGIFVPFGLGASYDLYDYPVGFESKNDYPKYDHESDLKVISLFIGASKSFGNFKAGIAFGPYYSSIYLRKVFLATVDPSLPVQYAQFPLDQKLEGSGYGFGGSVGILYSFNEKFDIGFSFRGFSKSKLKGNVNLALYTPENTYIKNYIKGDGDPTNDQDTIYFQGDMFESKGDAEADFPLPMNIGVGFKYSPNSKLALYVDLDYTLWQLLDRVPVKLSGKDPTGEPLEDDTLVLDWKNTLRVSFGAEYKFSDFLILRGGFYFDPSPIPEETVDPLIPDAGNKFSFNFGSGLNFGKIKLDLNYEFVFSPKKTISGIADPDKDGEIDNLPGDYESQIHAFGIGIRYSF